MNVKTPALRRISFLLLAGFIVAGFLSDVAPLQGEELQAADRGAPWRRHTIDDSSRGADGVRLADVNGDGLQDIVTGWEEGGKIRLYLNPGPEKATTPWPTVTVGNVASPEDAVFVDLDGDGATDVVSCCEGRQRTMFVHWAPADPRRYLDASAWKTEAIAASKGRSWMFAAPLQVDGRHGVDLVAGAKGAGAQVGWWEAPANPRNMAAWRWRPLYDAGWIMSLATLDMDGDGDLDVLTTDRKGRNSGCLWLENPGAKSASARWKQHRIGLDGKEVMFLDAADLDSDGLQDVLVATRSQQMFWLRRTSRTGRDWETHIVDQPENTGTGKGIRVGDIDLDGKPDIVFSCENAKDDRSGVLWMSYRKAPTERTWNAHEISGPRGIKFDLVKLLDIDADGDLDVVTCEERNNLGVFWYENPTR